MERDSMLYKIRRKLQKLAFYIVPHELLSKVYYKIIVKKNLDLTNPKTFNEKLQWLKLYYFPKNELAIKCTDKYQVREYIIKKGLEYKLTKLLGVWNNAKEIDWDKLPNQFVLKCTHGCAYNIVCVDKDKLDKKATIKQLNEWIKENFASFNVELHYGEIKHRRIICEEFLGEKLIDYKFFCFNGEPKFFYVSSDLIHDRQAEIGFFDINGEKLPLIRNDYKDISEVKLPESYNEMLADARLLAQDFPFVRVDFFICGESYNFAELTFTPAAAMMPLNPDRFDVEWGKMLELPKRTINE